MTNTRTRSDIMANCFAQWGFAYIGDRTLHENLSFEGSSGPSAAAVYEMSAVQLPELAGVSHVPL